MATANKSTTKAPSIPGDEAAGAAEAWRPNPGDTVDGTVVHLQMIDGEYGPYPCLTLDTVEGFVNIHAFHGVLQGRLKALRPGPGSELRITYHGKKEGNKVDSQGNKRSYHAYTVVDPTAPAESFTWDKVGEDDAPAF